VIHSQQGRPVSRAPSSLSGVSYLGISKQGAEPGTGVSRYGRPKDDRAGLEEWQVMSVTLINIFEVPAGEEDGFIAAWEKTRDYLKTPHCISRCAISGSGL
jgi:hypothetical protein